MSDGARSRALGSANKPDQGRLARTVTAQDPQLLAAGESEGNVIQYYAVARPGRVDLVHIFYGDHAGDIILV
jgi:hypothetical protein